MISPSYPLITTIPLWGLYDTENLTLLLLLFTSLHINAGLWDSSARYQLGSACQVQSLDGPWSKFLKSFIIQRKQRRSTGN